MKIFMILFNFLNTLKYVSFLNIKKNYLIYE